MPDVNILIIPSEASRTVLATIRNADFEPTIFEYLRKPPDRAMLEWLLVRMPDNVRAVLRENQPAYAQLGSATCAKLMLH